MENTGKILIIDDDNDLRSVLRDVLSDEGFSVSEASDGNSGIQAFSNDSPHAVLLDLNMPRMNGIDTLSELKQINPKVPVIILTAYGDIPTAVEAMRLGAYDFTTKPPEFDRLILLIKRAIELYRLETDMETVKNTLELSCENLLGRSSAMKKTIEMINHATRTDFSVIIQGETGTGKSFVAEVLHNLSKRAGKPFVRVDIGLLPDSLVESELFGYRKGAFTNAAGSKTGFFEAAHTGTIFIDEIENMSPVTQSKLLTVIERKEIYPIGSVSPVIVDIRIIAATNKDIRTSIAKKEFREDLFYRLGEFIITIPPLRERPEDVSFFAQKFLLDACAEMKKQIRGIDEDALAFLTSCSWSGNLRELKNVIRRAVLFSDTDTIEKKILESLINETHSTPYTTSMPLKNEIRELEKKRISEAIAKTEGNKTKAAELLQISYKSFCEKLKEYKIE
ncbi:MAG: sigma-54-dependent Fis family transcriptional regulator [Nitrospiraceae bacterium]|nr:MAG: sigma-54-dependent Fis family transcriptional regulator [Nitrospiraceae bacterium]